MNYIRAICSYRKWWRWILLSPRGGNEGLKKVPISHNARCWNSSELSPTPFLPLLSFSTFRGWPERERTTANPVCCSASRESTSDRYYKKQENKKIKKTHVEHVGRVCTNCKKEMVARRNVALGRTSYHAEIKVHTLVTRKCWFMHVRNITYRWQGNISLRASY